MLQIGEREEEGKSPEQKTTPGEWWLHFSATYQKQNPLSLFQRLSKAIDLFRPEQWRNDFAYLRIWLAYVSAHLQLYGDHEEVRSFYKYLKIERVGADQQELYLNLARFELDCGRPEKAIAVLENALSLCRGSNKLSVAINELRQSGNLTVESPLPQENFIPLIPMNMSSRRDSISGRESIGSVASRVSPSDMTVAGSRLRRLGNLGPPKRAILAESKLIDETKLIMEQSPKPQKENISPQRPQEPILPHENHVTMLTSESSMMADEGPEHNMSMTQPSPTVARTKPVSNEMQIDKVEPIHDLSRARVVHVNSKPYRVLQMIGRGGSSKVFKVLSSDHTILALKKVNLRNQDEATLEGYLNEISLLKSFSQAEHIIHLIDYEVNRQYESLFVLMEYGEADLGRLLKARQGKIDYNFIRFMWQQMLLAVQTVHAAKIVHCDLKPANFLLVGGTLKLIDFGISKAIMNDTTNIVRENQVGTINYMSPEALQESSPVGSDAQARIKIGRPSDIWSLGCIFHEMIYGKPPFAQFSLYQRLHKILDPSYEIPFGPLDYPTALDVLRICLVRQPKKRATLESLLQHPFLNPQHSQSRLDADETIVSRQQISDFVEKLSKAIPTLATDGLAERIFQQWWR